MTEHWIIERKFFGYGNPWKRFGRRTYSSSGWAMRVSVGDFKHAYRAVKVRDRGEKS